MNDEKKAVEIFEKMGHLITEEDVVFTSEHIIDFETQITDWLKKENDLIDGCRTMEFGDATHKNGTKLESLVLIDLGMHRAVLSYPYN